MQFACLDVGCFMGFLAYLVVVLVWISFSREASSEDSEEPLLASSRDHGRSAASFGPHLDPPRVEVSARRSC
jgi:hypothetical protein